MLKQNQKQVVEKNRRYGRGVAISLSRRVIKIHDILYRVESETTDGKFYSVIFKEEAPSSCNCFDYLSRKGICKHQFALMNSLVDKTVIDQTKERGEYSF